MKKIILFISLLLITGCFEKSGVITKECIKEEDLNDIKSIVKYDFSFKQDKLKDLKITYEYEGTDKYTINAIKSSLKSQNQTIESNILNDDDNKFTIEYQIPIKKDVLNNFNASESRTEMVKKLKEQGYVCN